MKIFNLILSHMSTAKGFSNTSFTYKCKYINIILCLESNGRDTQDRIMVVSEIHSILMWI